MLGAADLIDVKDPGGSSARRRSRPFAASSRLSGGRHPVSATLGDLPMVPALLADAARQTHAAGVDFVKIGFFPDGDHAACMAALGLIAAEGTALVAVLFADCAPGLCATRTARPKPASPEPCWIRRARPGEHCPDHLPVSRLQDFVTRARELRLMTGLAGSLRLNHIPALAALDPDYLGFRGALSAGIEPIKLGGTG